MHLYNIKMSPREPGIYSGWRIPITSISARLQTLLDRMDACDEKLKEAKLYFKMSVTPGQVCIGLNVKMREKRIDQKDRIEQERSIIQDDIT